MAQASADLDDCTRPQLLELFDRDRKFERKFCDAILKAGEKQFPVHRDVLGLVSKYFENLFNVEMKEKYAPEINIDLPAERLERILDYIYTDVDISTKNALDLLEDAEYTQIGFLKAQCAKFILQMVDVDNCLKLMAYAQRYNLPELVGKANRVIYGNFAVVVQQDDFKQLKDDAMSAIIHHENIKNQGEAVFTAIIQWITFDPMVRSSSFVELFNQLDLSTFSGNFLRSSVVTEALVRENHQCCMAVMDALTNPIPLQVQRTEATRVMHIGGINSKKGCFLYNVENGQKKILPQLINNAWAATAVRIGNKVFVFGGECTRRSCQVFDLTDRTWSTLANMPEGRKHAACAVINGMIYLTGGHDDDGNPSSTCFIYNPDNNSWSRAPNMTKPRTQHAMVQFNGSFYVFGESKQPYNSCEKFTDNRWVAIAPMQEGRLALAAVEVGGFLYAIGGSQQKGSLAYVERYDPRTNTWSKVQSMNVPRFSHGACVLQGKVYVFSDAWKNNKSVEVYDPQADTWTVRFNTDDIVSNACIVAV